MRIEATARLPELERIRVGIVAFAAQTGICREDCHRLVLIAEELFLNTVWHGYGGECDRPVCIGLDEAGPELHIRYEDEAPEFDPTSRVVLPATLDDTVEDRPVGGLGIFLALRLSRGLRYRRERDRNVVELAFVRTDLPG